MNAEAVSAAVELVRYTQDERRAPVDALTRLI